MNSDWNTKLPQAMFGLDKASNFVKAMHEWSLTTPRPELDEAARQAFGQRIKSLIMNLADHQWQSLLHASTDPYILPFRAAYDHYLFHLAQGREPTEIELLSITLHAFQSAQFALRMDSVRRSHQKVRNSLLQYVHDLKMIYPKLMIVRLDLWYAREYARNMLPELRILEDWEQLLRFIAQRFTPAWVGYAVKFEYGLKRGVHAHVMLFFNGREVREDETIGRIVGEHWQHGITQGVGGYFNSNTPTYKAQMEYCGIGTFTATTEDFRHGVARMTDYLAEPDHMVRLLVPGLDRCVRRSYLDHRQRDRLQERQNESVSDRA